MCIRDRTCLRNDLLGVVFDIKHYTLTHSPFSTEPTPIAGLIVVDDILQPGGSIFFTTINRTLCSYAASIVLAEYVLRVVPHGVHDWNKFISPEELQRLITRSMCQTFVLLCRCLCAVHLLVLTYSTVLQSATYNKHPRAI